MASSATAQNADHSVKETLTRQLLLEIFLRFYSRNSSVLTYSLTHLLTCLHYREVSDGFIFQTENVECSFGIESVVFLFFVFSLLKQLGIERVQACILANISRSRYVAIVTQPVHLLQIRPTVHN